MSAIHHSLLLPWLSIISLEFSVTSIIVIYFNFQLLQLSQALTIEPWSFVLWEISATFKSTWKSGLFRSKFESKLSIQIWLHD